MSEAERESGGGIPPVEQPAAETPNTEGAARPTCRRTCCECGSDIPRTSALATLCPGCLDRRRAEHAERQAREAEAARLADLERIRQSVPECLARIGVPAVLAGASFDTCPDLPRALVERTRRWADDPRGFLVLLGEPGSGKSWLAVAILRELLCRGVEGLRFVQEAAWLDTVRNEYGTITRDTGPAGASVLVFDDPGTAYLNDLRRAEVERLIRMRHARMLPTVIPGNLDLQGIEQTYGGRVLSVLQEYRNVLVFPRRDLRIDGSIRPTASTAGTGGAGPDGLA